MQHEEPLYVRAMQGQAGDLVQPKFSVQNAFWKKLRQGALPLRVQQI